MGVGALSSPLEVGADRAPVAAQQLAQILTAAGCEVVELGHLSNPDAAVRAGRRLAEANVSAVALAATSWFEDYLVLDLLEECRVPVLFWPLPGMDTGALCGTQQITSFLKVLEVAYCSVFGLVDDAVCLARARVFLRAAALQSRLHRCRVGAAGCHVNGMTHTAPNEFLLKKLIGPRIVWLDIPRLLQRAEEMPVAAAREHWVALRQQAGSCDVPDSAGEEALHFHAAIREVAQEHGLATLTVGCYPHLMGRPCLAASLLADEGIPLACEGDVHGAVGQYMLQLLTGQPTHNTDWLDPVDDFSVVFSHCGSGSWSLAERPENVRLASVRLMGQGVCTLFCARPGPVTLFNLTPQADGYQCGLLEGEACSTEMVFPGNPVRVRFAHPVRHLIDWIHDVGLGHHWMIGYGHVAHELRAWARIVGPSLHLREP